MFKLIVLCIVASAFIIVLSHGNMVGDGMWNLIDIEQCEPELEGKILQLDIKRTRINRTHDGISATLDADKVIDDSYGIIIDICKYVDGGCKQYQVVTDKSLVNLINKFAKNNVQRALELAKIDPPEFPVEEGHYEIEDFIMDYCELPSQAVFGKFGVDVFMVEGEEKVACMKLVIEFSKPEDDDEVC